jgi:hypothetical protein
LEDTRRAGEEVQEVEDKEDKDYKKTNIFTHPRTRTPEKNR